MRKVIVEAVYAGCGALVGLLIVTFTPAVSGDQSPEKRLIFRDNKKFVTMHVGDVLQVRPFTYAVTPSFLDAKLKVTVTNTKLALIGQIPTASGGEGKASNDAFLFATEAGKVTVKCILVNEDGKPIKGYSFEYTVEIK